MNNEKEVMDCLENIKSPEMENNEKNDVNKNNLSFIVLAGGCFWGTEHYFKKVVGVVETCVGYCGGDKDSPSYEEVCTGETNHSEVVKVVYNNSITNLNILLKHFFTITNPTTKNKQGLDEGTQYRSVIFYNNESERELITKFIDSIKPNYQDEIVTEIVPFKNFWLAEDYHQQYLSNNKGGYCHIPIGAMKKIYRINKDNHGIYVDKDDSDLEDFLEAEEERQKKEETNLKVESSTVNVEDSATASASVSISTNNKNNDVPIDDEGHP